MRHRSNPDQFNSIDGNDHHRGSERSKRRPIIIIEEEDGHYPSPSRPHHSGSTNNNSHQQQQQLKQQVIQLKQLIRLQNRVIVGLSSCFVLVVLSTLILIQHLPQPNDDQGPFWERNNNDNDNSGHLEKGGTAALRQITKNTNPTILQAANCTNYGCPIRPIEISQLNSTATRSLIEIASKNHILLTHKSNRKKPAPINQDRAVLIPSFGYISNTNGMNDINLHDNHENFFVGIFDGHDDNGHQIAQFASEEIPSRIAAKLYNASQHQQQHHGSDATTNMNVDQETVKQIITQTFIQVDSQVPITGGGCTANIMLRIGSKLYMANTGDSTSYLAIYTPPTQYNSERSQHNLNYISSPRNPNVQLHLQGTISIHYQNTKHKANFPTEQTRIESMGGKIHIPPKNPNGSRVIVRSALHGEDVGLAMSRSIGDWEWTVVGVIPDPDVVVVDLKQFLKENNVVRVGEEGAKKVFVVLGSDGLFDARRVEFVANHLAYGMFEYQNDIDMNSKAKKKMEASPKVESTNDGNGNDIDKSALLSKHVIEVGKKLVTMASPLKEEWYRDDITFIAKVIEL